MYKEHVALNVKHYLLQPKNLVFTLLFSFVVAMSGVLLTAVGDRSSGLPLPLLGKIKCVVPQWSLLTEFGWFFFGGGLL